MQMIQNRRRFLTGFTTAGAAGFLTAPISLHAEQPSSRALMSASPIRRWWRAY
jgi:hypothetical protein